MNEILIYGDIGFEVQAKDIVSQLNESDGEVSVRVDSYGGDVYAGISILNALRRYPDHVTVYVDGMAASAASFIAVGGADTLIMSPNSSLLIHGAWSQGVGNSEELAQLSYDLNQITDNLATIYAEKTGKDSAYWRELMKKDAIFTAEQAVEAGLADSVAESTKSVKAEQRHLVMAGQRSRFADLVGGRGVPDIHSRASAHPPNLEGGRSVSAPEFTTKPSDGQEGENVMSFLNKLAQELGMEEDNLRSKLVGIKNETVVVSGEVEVNYPTETLIVPTEKVTVEPIIGQEAAPAGDPGDGTTVVENSVADVSTLGLTFEVGTVPDGWTITVDEVTGTATATAPSGAEVGSIVEASIKVNGSTDVALTFKVRSLSEEPAETGVGPGDGEVAPQSAFAAAIPAGMSVVPTEHLNRLNAMARNFGAQQAELDRKNAEERVDRDIHDGRFHAQNKAQALAMLEQDPQSYEKVWGSLAKNTFPVAELGHSNTSGVNDPADDDFNPGQLAAERRKAKNGAK